MGLSSTRLQPFKHRRVQRKRAAAGVVRRRHSGAKKVWRRFIERHFLSIRRLETARAKVSQPVFRLVWCEETNKTQRQKRVVVKYTKKRLLKKKMLSRIPFGETKTGTYLLRAPSLSVLELFPGHVLQLNRRHHREYCTSSSTPSARRRRRRRVRRRPVVVFEDILKVVCKAGRNACGRIIRRRQRVALRRRTLRDDPVEVVTRCQSGCRQRGGGREEDHRSGLSFKAGSLKASARFLSTTRGGFASLFFLPFFLFFYV